MCPAVNLASGFESHRTRNEIQRGYGVKTQGVRCEVESERGGDDFPARNESEPEVVL